MTYLHYIGSRVLYQNSTIYILRKILHVPGDENIDPIAPIDHLPKDLTIGYPCKSQGDCGEGVCKFGLKLEKNKTVDVCECSEGWINFDGKACSYELKSKLTAFLLSFFIGWLGADWFYLAQGSGAYICAGIFKLITLGGLGIWFFIGKPIFSSRKQEL